MKVGDEKSMILNVSLRSLYGGEGKQEGKDMSRTVSQRLIYWHHCGRRSRGNFRKKTQSSFPNAVNIRKYKNTA